MARDNVDRTPWQPGVYFSPGEGNEACYWMPQTNFARMIAKATDDAIKRADNSSWVDMRVLRKQAAVNAAMKRGKK